MTTVRAISSEDDFTNATDAVPADTLQVVYFHAPWAAPCEHMSRVLEALAGQYPAEGRPLFLSIDAEELPDISEAFDVSAVPYIVLRRGKKMLETVSGGDAALVRRAIEKYAGVAGGNVTQGGSNSSTLPPQQSVTRPAEQPAPTDNSHTLTTAAAQQNGSTTANGETAQQIEEAAQEALFERLKELTTAAPCMLFMKGTPSVPQCGFSRQLVAILREHGVRYGFFNILADDDVRQGLKEYAEWPTFPQLWLNGELCGGLDIVREEVEANGDFFAPFSVKAKMAAAA